MEIYIYIGIWSYAINFEWVNAKNIYLLIDSNYGVYYIYIYICIYNYIFSSFSSLEKMNIHSQIVLSTRNI